MTLSTVSRHTHTQTRPKSPESHLHRRYTPFHQAKPPGFPCPPVTRASQTDVGWRRRGRSKHAKRRRCAYDRGETDDIGLPVRSGAKQLDETRSTRQTEQSCGGRSGATGTQPSPTSKVVESRPSPHPSRLRLSPTLPC